ncbi:MAG: NAD(P)H-dependent oxidoreductase [Pseudomonadota bacterium]
MIKAETMHVLTVLDHPNPASLSAALARQFMKGAKAAGHTAELADLHAEGFDPRWTIADIEADGGANTPLDVLFEQERIARADAICLIFPVFWWGMPAMSKGWVDRVWSYGWAYDQLDDREKSMQKKRPGVLLVPAGANSDDSEDAGYVKALETAWMQGTFGYFGFSPRSLEILYGSTGSEERRRHLLDQAYSIGAKLKAPEEE